MLHFNQKANKIDLFNVLEALKNNILCTLNCVKVASIVSFDSETLTSCCQIKGKRLMALKNDGNQELKDYPLIYAKTYFLGYGDIGITHPIEEGMEGILLFNDRELETWYITGESGNLAYDRTHDLSDAIFICGLCSQPNSNLIQYLEDCLNLYYKETSIQILETGVNIFGDTNITGKTTSDGLVDTTAEADAIFVTKDDKLVTIKNGIVKSVVQQ